MTEDEFIGAVKAQNQRLFLIALSFTRNKTDAEDILQNVFLKLWKYDRKFESDEHRTKWLTCVTVNESKNFVKKAVFRYNTSLENEVGESYAFESSEDSDLFGAVMKLPVKLRTVIHLFYYEDMSVKEIADILGIKESACKTRLSRGRSQLKEILGDDWRNE